MKNKQKYIPPYVSLFYVELEEGIANSSATVSGGGSDEPHTPLVEGWGAEELGGSTSGDF